MREFDVYLKQRLTEIDVIISQLVQRDSFTMFDWLYLSTSISNIEILKRIQVDSSMTLNTRMDNLLEILHEVIKDSMCLNTNIDLLNKLISGGKSEMELSTDEISVIEKSFTGGSSSLDIFASPLQYIIARSIGRVEFNTRLLLDSIHTTKYSLDKFMGDLELLADIELSSLKDTALDDLNLYFNVTPFDIFYMLTISGEATICLNALSIDDYSLKKVLKDLDMAALLSVNVDDDFELTKFIEINNSLNLLADIADVLIQFVTPVSDMSLSCIARAGLKRYRRLEDMDEFELSDFDDLSLEEVDFVTIVN